LPKVLLSLKPVVLGMIKEEEEEGNNKLLIQDRDHK